MTISEGFYMGYAVNVVFTGSLSIPFSINFSQENTAFWFRGDFLQNRARLLARTAPRGLVVNDYWHFVGFPNNLFLEIRVAHIDDRQPVHCFLSF